MTRHHDTSSARRPTVSQGAGYAEGVSIRVNQVKFNSDECRLGTTNWYIIENNYSSTMSNTNRYRTVYGKTVRILGEGLDIVSWIEAF